VYKFDCICGEPVTTPTKTGRCANCRRFFDLRWPNDAPPADAELAEAAKAAA
jgi:hypothetical protein